MSEEIEETPELSPLEKIRAERATKKAARDARKEAQLVKDYEAIGELEDKLGYPLQTLEGWYADGLPAVIAVRCPDQDEMRKYRKDASAVPRNTPAAAREQVQQQLARAASKTLAGICVKYPGPEELFALYEARPGLDVRTGLAALNFAMGEEETAGKE